MNERDMVPSLPLNTHLHIGTKVCASTAEKLHSAITVQSLLLSTLHAAAPHLPWTHGGMQRAQHSIAPNKHSENESESRSACCLILLHGLMWSLAAPD